MTLKSQSELISQIKSRLKDLRQQQDTRIESGKLNLVDKAILFTQEENNNIYVSQLNIRYALLSNGDIIPYYMLGINCLVVINELLTAM